MLSDHSSLSRLSVYIESQSPVAGPKAGDDALTMVLALEDEMIAPARRASNKVKQLTGDDAAQEFHNAKLAQANLPWYLRPGYSDTSIKMEFDGNVRAATVDALVERLTVDPLSAYSSFTSHSA